MGNYKNEMEFEDLLEIIDDHIDAELHIAILCNEELKNAIKTYLRFEYDLIDKDEAKGCSEYFLELYFEGEKDIDLYIQDAKARDGGYILSDSDADIDYYLFCDIDFDDMFKYFRGEFAGYHICSLIEDDFDIEEECNGDCENCEFDDSEYDDVETELFLEYTSELIERGLCPDCSFEFVKKLYETAYQIGFDDHRDEIREFNEMV